jgi:hypothetical protein
MRGSLAAEVLFVGITTGLWVAVMTHMLQVILAY